MSVLSHLVERPSTNPASKNLAERFLADPEIQRLSAETTRRFGLWFDDAVGKKLHDDEHRKFAASVCRLVAEPAAIFVARGKFDGNSHDIDGGIVFHVAKSRKQVEEILGLVEKERDPKAKLEKIQVDGHTEYRSKGNAELPGSMSLIGDYFIIAFGKESPSGIHRRMGGRSPEWLQAIPRELPLERPAAAMHLDMTPIWDFAAADEKNREALQYARRFSRLDLVTGLDGADCVTRILVGLDQPTAKLAQELLDRPLKPADLALAPRDASWAAALRFDPGHLHRAWSGAESKRKGRRTARENRPCRTCRPWKPHFPPTCW